MDNLREQIKELKIFREMSYEEVRDSIMSNELNVNSVVKIYDSDRMKIPISSEFLPRSGPKNNFFEYTILHLALYVDDVEFIDFLLENNADMKLETEDLAPVILSAIRLNRLKDVKKIVSAGADVNQSICVKNTDEKYSDRLINTDGGNNNAHIFYEVYSPLEFAINLNAYEIAEFLISQGANVHGRDYDEEFEDSPMSIAASSNNVEMIKLLMKHGVDINARDINGLTPLMKAALEDVSSASLRFLLSQPFIKINSLTNDQSSCLHFPEPWYMEEDIVDPESNLQDLLDAGCDINIVSNHGELPIDTYEDKEKCLEVMKKHIVKLMAAGFYVCARNKEAVSESELRNFRVECDTEVEVMKNTYGIMVGFSLFDILHRSYHKLALRIKDGDEDKFDYKMAAQFPLYAGMIKYRLEKAGQRRKLFKQVENILYKVFSRYLPATFIHEMFFYFSNFELSKLVENKLPPEKQCRHKAGNKEMCFEIMKKHIVKLMAAGFYVCDRNKKFVSGSELRKFRVECDTEVEVMKNTYGIMAGFSLYDILHRSYHKLALRIKDGDEDKFDDKMAAKFPLYAGMIKYRLEKAGQRRKLFNQVENILYKVFSKYLPATFIREMFFYFSNFELSKLSEINSEFLPLTDPEKYFFEYTILHLALYVDDSDFVDFLLKNNADTKLETEHLAAVILSAISVNSLKYVKKLVTAGVDVNQIICLDAYKIAEFLISQGANVHRRIGNDGENTDSPIG
ncbi:Similar to FPV218: Putative ankyrin repeat protein FPV218 (Fowlpox virus (strain NVSL)) [Cotesia congregata]|uniref:Similar to FPV218: Putative ankyrin repeat protein FPV218 (Fowlpox virus (Strain NVSL)) n=1 Tax=Cotesia congregata TaxID=51543 RepID=A0A8J2HDX3_COTCN|nr:Similar to FPV218: Putative ankyrin repeat protein FPV218 (Fowlpox virus (strain NVSL)) [Cotesia congregata]